MAKKVKILADEVSGPSSHSMFRRFYIPKALCSEGSMFRMPIGPRRVASRTPVRTCVHIVRESKKKYDPIEKVATS